MREAQETSTEFGRHWSLSPKIAFLNHGSFGACPLPVLDAQQRLRDRIEQQPVQFFVRDLEGLLETARVELADFLGADAADLVFVPNATTGINAVLRSLNWAEGDELLTTNHEYNACRNALDFVAQRAGARVVVATLPFPLNSVDEVYEAMLSRVTPRTRLAMFDHVTSQTGLVLPVEELVRELTDRGVESLVDGAHAPGMLPLDLRRIGAAYYTGNCHKWLCAPKGAGFLHVSRDRQDRVRPVVISHGATAPQTKRTRYRNEFDWVGTDDPTAVLSVPEAIRFMGALLPGGWPALRERNRALVLSGRDLLCDALAIPAPCPDGMIGSMASLPLPPGTPDPPKSALYSDPLQDELLERGVEVPVIPWPAPPERLIRISGQIYNRPDQYRLLADLIRDRFPQA